MKLSFYEEDHLLVLARHASNPIALSELVPLSVEQALGGYVFFLSGIENPELLNSNEIDVFKNWKGREITSAISAKAFLRYYALGSTFRRTHLWEEGSSTLVIIYQGCPPPDARWRKLAATASAKEKQLIHNMSQRGYQVSAIQDEIAGSQRHLIGKRKIKYSLSSNIQSKRVTADPRADASIPLPPFEPRDLKETKCGDPVLDCLQFITQQYSPNNDIQYRMVHNGADWFVLIYSVTLMALASNCSYLPQEGSGALKVNYSPLHIDETFQLFNGWLTPVSVQAPCLLRVGTGANYCFSPALVLTKSITKPSTMEQIGEILRALPADSKNLIRVAVVDGSQVLQSSLHTMTNWHVKDCTNHLEWSLKNQVSKEGMEEFYNLLKETDMVKWSERMQRLKADPKLKPLTDKEDRICSISAVHANRYGIPKSIDTGSFLE